MKYLESYFHLSILVALLSLALIIALPNQWLWFIPSLSISSLYALFATFELYLE